MSSSRNDFTKRAIQRSVIARNEVTKQSMLRMRSLDCFAALAMTAMAGLFSISAATAAEPGHYGYGKPATPANVEAVRVATGASSVRSLKPGQPMTMDYRGDRANVMQDAKGNIDKITCG